MLAAILASALAAAGGRSEAIYQGRNQNADDPSCIFAAGVTGPAYLLLAAQGDFKRIEAKSKLQLAADGPALGADEIFISGDDNFVVGHDGRGTGYNARLEYEYVHHGYRGTGPYSGWKVAEWSQAGSWKPSDEVKAGFVAALAGGDGAMWAVGKLGTSEEQWLVRHRPAGGTWTTADTQPGAATAVHVFPGSAVFVAGIQATSQKSADAEWVVRRSTDGKTWTTVDRFSLKPGYHAVPRSIAADASGNVYVVGYGTVNAYSPEEIDSLDATHWVVRVSHDGGLHFATSDDFSPQKRGESIADDVTILSSGDVVVVGGAGSRPRRYIRVLRHGEKRWQTVGTTPEANYEHRFAVAAAGPDSVYVAGDTLVKRTSTCTIERVSLK